MDEQTRRLYKAYMTGDIPEDLPIQMQSEISYAIQQELRSSNKVYCTTCGGVIPKSTLDMHIQFHRKIYAKETNTVSSVKWCDTGNHPFKAGEEGSASFQGTQMINGVTESITQDMCSKHNPMRAEPETVRRELEKAYPVPDLKGIDPNNNSYL